MSKKHTKNNREKNNSNSENNNEYIKDTSPIVYQKGKLKSELHIRTRPDLTEKQKELLKLINSKECKLLLLEGPAGSSKSYISIMAALQLLSEKKVSDIMYIRSIVESADHSMGYLKGDFDTKLQPYLIPMMDKLDELLPKSEVELLIKEQRIQGQPINFLRGQHFNAKFLLGDEIQNFSYSEIFTTITRIGQFGRAVLCGDQSQSDIGSKSGFSKIISQFDDEESRQHGIFVFRFGEEDIVRSELVKFIIQKTNKVNN